MAAAANTASRRLSIPPASSSILILPSRCWFSIRRSQVYSLAPKTRSRKYTVVASSTFIHDACRQNNVDFRCERPNSSCLTSRASNLEVPMVKAMISHGIIEQRRSVVAVGTPITRRPPRRSVQAVLPHTALTLDSGGKRYSPHIAQSVGHANSRTVSGTCQIERCFSLVHALPSPTSAEAIFVVRLVHRYYGVVRLL